MRGCWWIGVLALGAGCAGSSVVPTDEALARLGIASLDVAETTSELVIVGRDAARSEIARLDLKLGAFTMSAAAAEDRVGAEREVDGVQLDLRFGAIALRHESAGHAPLFLPMPPSAQYDALYAFVASASAEPVLRRWGVAFLPRVAAGLADIPYDIGDGNASCGNVNSYVTIEGAGNSCPQLFGTNEKTNGCNSNGAYSIGCAVAGYTGNSTYPNTTWLTQCCNIDVYGNHDTGVQNPSAKACRPTHCSQNSDCGPDGTYSCSGGICNKVGTECGDGGGVGCAVCWSAASIGLDYSSCYVFADPGQFSSTNNCANFDACAGLFWSCRFDGDCCNTGSGVYCNGGTCTY